MQMAEIYRTIQIPGTLTTSYQNSSGYGWYTRLPAGFLYYIEDAYFYAATTVARDTTNGEVFYLKDEDGNTIASLSGHATALTGTGAAFASFSSTYREIDATSAAKRVKLCYVTSGSGQQPIDAQVILRIAVKRSGTAA